MENTGLDIEIRNKLFLRPGTFCVRLAIGRWKALFTPDQYKIIIASALNHTTRHHGLNITGYLLTKKNLYLIPGIKTSDLKTMLERIFDRVEEEVKRLLEKRRIYKLSRGIVFSYDEEILIPMFVPYLLFNNDLLYLLTGRPVDLPFYYPWFERLKRRLHNYSYSSVPDYEGAKSPVIVRKLHHHHD